MGRLTEILDTVQNGFQEPEMYSHIDIEDEGVRDKIKLLRKIVRKRKRDAKKTHNQ